MTWLKGLSVILAFFFGCFLVWRRLREEYPGERILEMWIAMTLAAVVIGVSGYWLAYRDWGWWIWGGVIGIIGTLGWWCKKYDWNFWEVGDRLAGAGMGMGMVLTGESLDWKRAVGFLAGAVFLKFVAVTYRRWRWYASGRPGVLGMAGLMWLGGIELAVAGTGGDRLYWGGLEVSQWVGLWTAIASGTVIYLRSGRKTSEDLLNLWPKITLKKKLNHRF